MSHCQQIFLKNAKDSIDKANIETYNVTNETRGEKQMDKFNVSVPKIETVQDVIESFQKMTVLQQATVMGFIAGQMASVEKKPT